MGALEYLCSTNRELRPRLLRYMSCPFELEIVEFCPSKIFERPPFKIDSPLVLSVFGGLR